QSRSRRLDHAFEARLQVGVDHPFVVAAKVLAGFREHLFACRVDSRLLGGECPETGEHRALLGDLDIAAGKAVANGHDQNNCDHETYCGVGAHERQPAHPSAFLPSLRHRAAVLSGSRVLSLAWMAKRSLSSVGSMEIGAV